MHKIRKADIHDIDNIINIMNEIDHPLFIKDDKDYVQRHIDDEGFILVAKSEKIEAYLMIHYCDYDEDVSLNHIAYMDSVGVRYSARGQGLMKSLIQEAERMLEGEYCYYMATVHPDNIYSLRVFESLGYKCVKTVYRYNNNIRNLMLKKTKS